MSKIKINELELSPLLLSNSNILPCLDRCYFTKNFTKITNFKIYKTNDSVLHIDVTDNESYISINDSGDQYKFKIYDILITFPAVHQISGNKDHKFFGEVLIMFYNSNLKKYAILSVFLDNTVNESTTLCSSLFNDINTFVKDLENDKTENGANIVDTIMVNDKKYDVDLDNFEISDLLPKNNTYYTYEENGKIWYIYKNTLNLSNSCSLYIRKYIENDLKQSTSNKNVDIFIYNDVNNTDDDDEKCVISIIQKVDHTYEINDEEDNSDDTSIINNEIEETSIMSNIIFFVINFILLIVFIILYFVFKKKNQVKPLLILSIVCSIFIFISSIIYFSIWSNNIIIQSISVVFISLNFFIGIGIIIISLKINNLTPVTAPVTAQVTAPVTAPVTAQVTAPAPVTAPTPVTAPVTASAQNNIFNTNSLVGRQLIKAANKIGIDVNQLLNIIGQSKGLITIQSILNPAQVPSPVPAQVSEQELQTQLNNIAKSHNITLKKLYEIIDGSRGLLTKQSVVQSAKKLETIYEGNEK